MIMVIRLDVLGNVMVLLLVDDVLYIYRDPGKHVLYSCLWFVRHMSQHGSYLSIPIHALDL